MEGGNRSTLVRHKIIEGSEADPRKESGTPSPETHHQLTNHDTKNASMVVDEADMVVPMERERIRKKMEQITIPRIELLHRCCKTSE